jgi:hypothetical protein
MMLERLLRVLVVSAASFPGARLKVDAARMFEEIVYIDIQFSLVSGIRAFGYASTKKPTGLEVSGIRADV